MCCCGACLVFSAVNEGVEITLKVEYRGSLVHFTCFTDLHSFNFHNPACAPSTEVRANLFATPHND